MGNRLLGKRLGSPCSPFDAAEGGTERDAHTPEGEGHHPAEEDGDLCQEAVLAAQEGGADPEVPSEEGEDAVCEGPAASWRTRGD